MVGRTNVAGARLRSVIAVTYPAGSICTCTNGTRTLKARDTSGKALFNVTVGEWTVSCTDGVNTKDEIIEITNVGQCVSLELSYALYLYKPGDECLAITGGWDTLGNANITRGTEYLQFKPTDADDAASILTANAIDLTQYNILSFDVSLDKKDCARFGVWKEKNGEYTASVAPTATGRTTVEFDVSGLSGEYYVAATGYYYSSVGQPTIEIYEAALT